MTDEQIRVIIDKIKAIASKDGKFKAELIKEFGTINTNSSEHVHGTTDLGDKRLEFITSYLALDNEIDSISSIIDYSWVNDYITKQQLVADNREMLRFRLNCRSHKADFFEFCKFAHFQYEALINYFYRTICSHDLERIKRYIKRDYPAVKGIDDKKTLGAISYSVKMIAYQNRIRQLRKDNPSKHYMELSTTQKLRIDTVKNIRNWQSHRNDNESADYLDLQSYRDELVKDGFSINEYGEVWNSNRDKYYNVINSDDYKEFLLLTIINLECYEKVSDDLKEFTRQIKNNIEIGI